MNGIVKPFICKMFYCYASALCAVNAQIVYAKHLAVLIGNKGKWSITLIMSEPSLGVNSFRSIATATVRVHFVTQSVQTLRLHVSFQIVTNHFCITIKRRSSSNITSGSRGTRFSRPDLKQYISNENRLVCCNFHPLSSPCSCLANNTRWKWDQINLLEAFTKLGIRGNDHDLFYRL